MKLFLIFAILVICNLEGKEIYRNLLETQNLGSAVHEEQIYQETQFEYIIKKNTTYSFNITNENYLYSFSSELENFFFIEKEGNFESMPNETFFKNGDIIYVNMEANLEKDITITISPIPIYRELNSIETINENRYFFIESEVESILYLDTFDRNSSIYLSETFKKEIFANDTKITGKFYPIEPNRTYFIKNRIYSNCSVSNFKKYFYPIDFETINIKNDEESFLYLQKGKKYTLNFQDNTMNKMIKLSKKTLSSIVKIFIEEKEVISLNQESPYYQLENNFNKKLILEIIGDNAFIEFLSNTGDYQVLDKILTLDYPLTKDIAIIKIEKTQKMFGLNIESNKILNFSLSIGLSNNINYYYSSNSNYKIDILDKEIFLFYLPYKNLEVLEDEFVSLSINFERQENQTINISYIPFTYIDEILEEEISKDQCEDIISNLTDLLEIYIYTDIAKNPPQIDGHPNYHHRKVDLTGELKNVSTSNRTYYEFFQEIQKILTTPRDLHFRIQAYITNSGFPIYYYMAFLPFTFLIRKDNNNQSKIFIEKSQLFAYFDEDIRKFVESHLNIPLKTINDIDAFDYIQKWSKFNRCKNVHSEFTYRINYLWYFYLSQYPVDFTDLINEYEFEDNQIMKIPYLVDKPKLSLNSEYKDEFDKYFLRTMEMNNFFVRPPFNEIEDNFLIEKGLKKKPKILKKDKIDWNITLDGSYNYTFKCRVDDANEVNVVYQNTFSLDLKSYIGSILECADLFYSNKYPIIIIESLNGGGYAIIHMIMHQIFQMRTTNRAYYSYGMKEKAKEYLKTLDWDDLNLETCEKITSFDNFTEIIDYYDYDGLNISHKRTNAIDYLSLSFRKAMDNYRRQYINSEYLKKPTDIIILTDAFSYSATSGLIKNFQNTGSAIIVGYFGNPKIGDDIFDGSQSPSSVTSLSEYKISNNLLDLGFYVGGVTYTESFDISKQYHNSSTSFPREYEFDPVDERVEIYSKYTDDIYDEFINEGKNIYEKYENVCNPNNTKLLLHHENCQKFSDSGLENAHGGYKCNKETSSWETDQCFPYYCDIGYFYDREQNKCVKECPFENKSTLLYKKYYSENITVPFNETYEFWIVSRYNNYYIFEASVDAFSLYPRIFAVNYYENVILNEFKNSTSDIQLKIHTFATKTHYATLQKIMQFDSYTKFDIRSVFFVKPLVNHVFYSKGLFDNNKTKIAIIDDKITFNDIEKSNKNYFKNYSSELYYFEAGKSYAVEFNYENCLDQIQFYINPVKINENISIIGNSTNYLYLQKNKTYKLNIEDTTIKRALKLSRNSLNSEVIIDDATKLNSDNLYYTIDNNFTGEIKLEVNNEDAFIEFVYNFPNIKKLDFEKFKFNLTDKYNLITIPKNYSLENIKFELKGENSSYSIYKGYSINDYNYYRFTEQNDQIRTKSFSFSINETYTKLKVLDNEYYNVMIELFKGKLSLEITKESNKKKVPYGLLALIIAAAILLIIIIIVIIIICRKNRKQISNKQIEEKLETLKEIDLNNNLLN